MIGNAFTALQHGRILSNASSWKNRTIAVNSIAALLGVALGVARAFGIDLVLDEAQIDALALLLFTAVGMFNGWSTAVTSDKVGVPAQRPPDSDSGSGSQGTTEWDAEYRHPGSEP